MDPTRLDALPDLRKLLADAKHEVNARSTRTFRLNVKIDRNTGLITMKVLVASALVKSRTSTSRGRP
jgi:hypothetical protein